MYIMLFIWLNNNLRSPEIWGGGWSPLSPSGHAIVYTIKYYSIQSVVECYHNSLIIFIMWICDQ